MRPSRSSSRCLGGLRDPELTPLADDRVLPRAFYEVLIIGPAAEFSRRWLGGVPGLDVDVAMRVLPETVWRPIAAEEA